MIQAPFQDQRNFYRELSDFVTMLKYYIITRNGRQLVKFEVDIWTKVVHAKQHAKKTEVDEKSIFQCIVGQSYKKKQYHVVLYKNSFRAILRLSQYYNASGIIAEYHIDGFHTILSRTAVSLLNCIYCSVNDILRVVTSRINCWYYSAFTVRIMLIFVHVLEHGLFLPKLLVMRIERKLPPFENS